MYSVCLHWPKLDTFPKKHALLRLHLSPAFLSFLFLYTDRMTSTLPRMSTTMVKISTLASVLDSPVDEAPARRSLSFRDGQSDPFSPTASPTSKPNSIFPQAAAAMAGIIRCRVQLEKKKKKRSTYPKIPKCSQLEGVLN